jgi:hypothetical protein
MRVGTSVIKVVPISRSNFHSGAREWLGRLFTVPKGFGKYYPPSTGGTAGKTSRTAGDAASKAGKSTGGGGGGGSKGGAGGGGNRRNDFPNVPEGNWRGALLVLAGVATATALMSGDQNRHGKEISWQEFQSQLLESGQVDRIIVSNKTVAR